MIIEKQVCLNLNNNEREIQNTYRRYSYQDTWQTSKSRLVFFFIKKLTIYKKSIYHFMGYSSLKYETINQKPNDANSSTIT